MYYCCNFENDSTVLLLLCKKSSWKMFLFSSIVKKQYNECKNGVSEYLGIDIKCYSTTEKEKGRNWGNIWPHQVQSWTHLGPINTFRWVTSWSAIRFDELLSNGMRQEDEIRLIHKENWNSSFWFWWARL